jgi:hypothetical protein
MWYNTITAKDEVQEIKEHFKLDLFQAITLLDKGYTSDYLIREYGDMPKSWLLELLD